MPSTSHAHVIPVVSVVSRKTIHGLDVAPMLPYVAALEDPTLPLAPLTWENPTHGRIATETSAGQAVSVQVTYDPGWTASIQGRRCKIRRDELGLIVIEPDRPG